MDDSLFPIEQRRELLTLEETAERLRITVPTLRRWMKAGKFPMPVQDREEQTISYKISKTVQRVLSSDLIAWLESRGQSKRPADRAA